MKKLYPKMLGAKSWTSEESGAFIKLVKESCGEKMAKVHPEINMLHWNNDAKTDSTLSFADSLVITYEWVILLIC